MVDGALASISQRQIVTANIDDRDNPSILSDMLLAWPVQRVVAAGDYLFQIADGSAWWDADPALRITTIADPDTILSELSIGSEMVLDAAIRDGRLLVLRGEGLKKEIPWLIRPRGFADLSSSASDQVDAIPSLTLEFYDLSNPLSPVLSGSISVELSSGSRTWETSRMLFPATGVVAVVARQSPFWRWGGWLRPMPLVADENAKILSASVAIPYDDLDWSVAESQLVAVFQPDLLDAKTVELPQDKIVALDSVKAADGIVVFGLGDKLTATSSPDSKRSHYAGILDLTSPSAPALRDPVSLPGRLVGVADLDRRGFLAWTESLGSDGNREGFAISASDMKETFMITTLTASGFNESAFDGRGIFVSNASQIKGYQLQDSGNFKSIGSMDLGFSPDTLCVVEDDIYATSSNRFAAMPLTSFPDKSRVWNVATWVDSSKILSLQDKSYLSPSGDYGVEIFK
jgi:hypothetical protein